MGDEAGGLGWAFAMRARRSGKQVGSFSISVGVGGAVGGGIGEVMVVGGKVGLAVLAGVVWFVSLGGASVGAFSGFEGGSCCSVAYEKCLMV